MSLDVSLVDVQLSRVMSEHEQEEQLLEVKAHYEAREVELRRTYHDEYARHVEDLAVHRRSEAEASREQAVAAELRLRAEQEELVETGEHLAARGFVEGAGQELALARVYVE